MMMNQSTTILALVSCPLLSNDLQLRYICANASSIWKKQLLNYSGLTAHNSLKEYSYISNADLNL